MEEQDIYRKLKGAYLLALKKFTQHGSSSLHQPCALQYRVTLEALGNLLVVQNLRKTGKK